VLQVNFRETGEFNIYLLLRQGSATSGEVSRNFSNL
jgi:hypothetical protein